MDEHPVAWHNVAELIDDGDAIRPQRVPETVRVTLNEQAQERLRQPAGVELRFVPDGPVEVTLSAEDPCVVRPFWGPLQGRDRFVIGTERTTIEIERHERLAAPATELDNGVFAPYLCRLRFHGGPIRLHDVVGSCRPPEADETPDRRYLAYGTSITQGGAASEPQHTYVAGVGRRLGVDAINLGSGGSAYCEPEIADYIADRADWDVATLGLSVNMVGAGFSIETYRERIQYLIERIADSDPERPVIAITLFPHFRDPTVSKAPPERDPEPFREALRSAVAAADRPNLRLVEGRDLLTIKGLSTDLIHPGDDGFAEIATGLVDRLSPLG